MAGVNKVIIVGNIGKDPEVRYTPGGDPIVNAAIATSETWKDKNSGQKQEKTEWHRVVFFGGLAKIASEYLHKGSKVYIEGKLQTRKWQDKSGQDRYTTEIVIDGFSGVLQMLDSKGSGGGQNANQNANQNTNQGQQQNQQQQGQQQNNQNQNYQQQGQQQNNQNQNYQQQGQQQNNQNQNYQQNQNQNQNRQQGNQQQGQQNQNQQRQQAQNNQQQQNQTQPFEDEYDDDIPF